MPRSRDLVSWAVLLSSCAFIFTISPFYKMEFFQIAQDVFTFDDSIVFSTDIIFKKISWVLFKALTLILPVFFVIIVITIFISIAFGGWSFTASNFSFKFERINLLKGLKRLMSLQSLYEWGKSLLKLVIVSFLAYAIIAYQLPILMKNSQLTLAMAVSKSITTLFVSILILAASIAIIVLFDVPYQMWQHMRKLRMTHQEIRDEYRETDGRPEVKSKIRQLQRQMARQRMMEEVPKADVVITNPTHYAVALKYDHGRSMAPILVAKGTGLIAANIRKVAEVNEIMVVSAPPLARSLYFYTDFKQEIPVGLYVAVAQVLAYVYQLKNVTDPSKPKPEPPTDLPIPEELKK